MCLGIGIGNVILFKIAFDAAIKMHTVVIPGGSLKFLTSAGLRAVAETTLAAGTVASSVIVGSLMVGDFAINLAIAHFKSGYYSGVCIPDPKYYGLIL